MTNKEIIQHFVDSDEFQNLQKLHAYILQDMLIYGQALVNQNLLDKYNVKMNLEDLTNVLGKVYDKSDN